MSKIRFIYALCLSWLVVLGLAACGGDTAGIDTQISAADYGLEVSATNEWNSGFQGAVTVSNISGEDVSSFKMSLELASGTINQIWNAEASGDTISSPSWLQYSAITQGNSFEVGFTATGSFSGAEATLLEINGKPVDGSGPTDPDPSEPDPSDPDPTVPDPSDPDPSDPDPTDPSAPDPSDPDPSDPDPSDPDPSDPDPSEPDPSNPPAPDPIGGSWTAEGGRILLDGKVTDLNGLNWFGFDAGDKKLHGLWTGRPMEDFLDQMVDLGFNSLRIPLCPASINPGNVITDPIYNKYGDDSQAIFKSLLREMGERNMYALLDIHTYDCGNHLTGTMLDAAYGKAAWLSDLRTLATIAKDYPNVAGIDVYNEPHKLTWDEWRGLVSDASDAILAVNKDLLIFVEGVGGESTSGEHESNWGGNLFEAARKLPDVPKDKLVFTPHAYGHSVFAEHEYFKDPSFPANMPEVWDSHFGYLIDLGYAVVPGEFGGRYVGDDKVWQDAFIDYLADKDVPGFFYWSLNPNSGDTGGLLQDDWKTVNPGKLALLQRLLDR